MTGGSGKPMPMLTFTSAIAVTGKKLTNANRIVPNTNFFIFCIFLHPFQNGFVKITI